MLISNKIIIYKAMDYNRRQLMWWCKEINRYLIKIKFSLCPRKQILIHKLMRTLKIKPISYNNIEIHYNKLKLILCK